MGAASRIMCIPITGLLVLVCGCGDGAGPASSSGMKEYVDDSLPTWDAYARLLPSQDTVVGDTTIRTEVVSQDINGVVRDITYRCVVTPHSLTETPTEIVMYEPNASIMWAGNLIQGRSYRGGLGTFQELSIRQRAPLRLSIDLLTAGNFAVVDLPSLTTVQSAIGDLVQRAQDAGHQSGSSINFDSRLTYKSDQAMLKMGISAHWFGGRAHTTLKVQRNAAKRTLIAHFVQKMFTIAIELPQSPGAFFSSDFTPALLREQIDGGNIGPDNVPVYLASITYGRTLTYSLTSTYSEDRMRAAISASFNGLVGSGSGYTETELRQTLSQDNIRVVAIGGDGQNVLDLISQGNLKAYFTTDAPLTTARPISYQLNALRDNRLALVSETTSYLLDDCAEVPAGDVVSDFEVDNEGWTLEGATTPQAQRGSRAPIEGLWFIRGEDGATNTMYFRAPGKFWGDKSTYYGGNLSYWVRWNQGGGPFGDGGPLVGAPDVMLIGANGTTLTFRFGLDAWPQDQWAFRQVSLDTRADWRVAGQPATEEQVRGVLANVLQVKIRGQYRQYNDIGSVDRVVLSKDPAPPL